MGYKVSMEIPFVQGKPTVNFDWNNGKDSYTKLAMSTKDYATQYAIANKVNKDLFGIESKEKAVYNTKSYRFDAFASEFLKLVKGVWNYDYCDVLRDIEQKRDISMTLVFTKDGKFSRSIHTYLKKLSDFGFKSGDIVMNVEYIMQMDPKNGTVFGSVRIKEMIMWTKVNNNIKLENYRGGDLAYMIRDILRG